MPNKVIAPGFETPDPAWTFLGAGQRRDDLGAHSGSWAAYLRGRAGFGATSSSVLQIDLPASVGEEVPVRAWVDGDARGSTSIGAFYDPTGLGDWALLDSIYVPPGPGWSEWIPGSFVALAPTVGIWFNVQIPPSGDGYWLLDDVVVGTEDAVARMLRELAIKATLKTLQGNLNAEIAGIQAERNDGLVLPTVKSWFGWKRPISTPDTVECDVFSAGARPNRWSHDLSTQADGQRGPLVTSYDLIVGINFANREGHSAGQMVERGMRYEAALVRVIQNNPRLGQGDVVLVADAQMDPEGPRAYGLHEDIHVAGRASVLVRVQLQESHSNEMTTGGGVPPSALIESL